MKISKLVNQKLKKIIVYKIFILEGMQYNFEKYKTTEVESSEPYDYESIMHYPKNAFSKNGRDTIVQLKRGSQIGDKNELSQIDISEIRKLYNCIIK